jgi:hypothetical protein
LPADCGPDLSISGAYDGNDGEPAECYVDVDIVDRGNYRAGAFYVQVVHVDGSVRGLPGEAVAIWLYGATLTVTVADEPLAQYHVIYQPDQRQVARISDLEQFDTPYQSPQPLLWEPRDGEWLSVIRDPPHTPRRQHMSTKEHQLALPLKEESSIG